MRSTARWVLPVLVGPRTATRRERSGESFMTRMWRRKHGPQVLVFVIFPESSWNCRMEPAAVGRGGRVAGRVCEPARRACGGGRLGRRGRRRTGGALMHFGQVEGTDIVVLDPRFKRLFAGYVRVERLWTGAVWSEGPAWFAAGRYLVWSDIPNNRMLRCVRGIGPGFGVPRAVQQFQRQHGRQPGPARHLRALDARG